MHFFLANVKNFLYLCAKFRADAEEKRKLVQRDQAEEIVSTLVSKFGRRLRQNSRTTGERIRKGREKRESKFKKGTGHMLIDWVC